MKFRLKSIILYILIFLTFTNYAQETLRWVELETCTGCIREKYTVALATQNHSHGLGQQFFTMKITNTSSEKIQLKGYIHAILTCGNKAKTEFNITLKPGETKGGNSYVMDVHGLTGSAEVEQCKGRQINISGKERWTRIESIEWQVNEVIIPKEEVETENITNSRQTSNQNNSSNTNQEREDQTRISQERENQNKRDNDQQKERQRQNQARIDEQANAAARTNGEQIKAISGIGDALGGIIQSRDERNSRTAREGADRAREREIDELQSKVNNEDGELVNCMHCRGNGREQCSRCNASGKEDCQSCKILRGTCQRCDGKGSYMVGSTSWTCPRCSGKGHYSCALCNTSGKRVCMSCNGQGAYNCRHCKGTGQIFKKSKIINSNNQNNNGNQNYINSDSKSNSNSKSNQNIDNRSQIQLAFNISENKISITLNNERVEIAELNPNDYKLLNKCMIEVFKEESKVHGCEKKVDRCGCITYAEVLDRCASFMSNEAYDQHKKAKKSLCGY